MVNILSNNIVHKLKELQNEKNYFVHKKSYKCEIKEASVRRNAKKNREQQNAARS